MVEGEWLMLVLCPPAAIEHALLHLRDAGTRHQECVVLWLGKRESGTVRITRCYRPLQHAKMDQFHIPPEGMAALQGVMRSERLMVAAQVHSHPDQAFHSKADDAWAIVRHEGALSLVVPRFAADTFPANFLQQTKTYRFSPQATWDEVASKEMMAKCLQIL
jgi:proteasome lid subunit RPN8/RPN11